MRNNISRLMCVGFLIFNYMLLFRNAGMETWRLTFIYIATILFSVLLYNTFVSEDDK